MFLILPGFLIKLHSPVKRHKNIEHSPDSVSSELLDVAVKSDFFFPLHVLTIEETIWRVLLKNFFY